MTVVCLGEALVDLICPEPLDDPIDADRFEPHFGGALANVAVAVARHGAPAALAGGVGDDEWGRFLRERLERERVDVSLLATVEELTTPFAFATFDRELEPRFRIHGDLVEAGVGAVADRLDELATTATALVFGSNTLVSDAALETTLRAKELVLERGGAALFDPNLRPGRWREIETARQRCRQAIDGLTVVKANLDEARWLSGEPGAGPGAAAESLHALGAELAIVTAGAEPALARGAATAEARPPRVEVVSPLGAGDAFMGTLAGALHARRWRLEEIGPALEDAVRASAEACTRLGAIE